MEGSGTEGGRRVGWMIGWSIGRMENWKKRNEGEGDRSASEGV